MKLPITHKYDDILDLPHPVSRRARMTPGDRAIQFAPFAALTGYEEVIGETARLTDGRVELEEGAEEELNEALRQLRENLHRRPEITVTWFRRDEKKEGGAYVTATGRARKLCLYSGTLLLEDGRTVALEDMIFLEVKAVTAAADSPKAGPEG